MANISVTSKDVSVRARIGRFIREFIYYIINNPKIYNGTFNYGEKVLKGRGDITIGTRMKPKRP